MQANHFTAEGADRPVLLVGLVGFDVEQERQLGQLLACAGPSYLAWRIGSFARADAWLVNGSRTEVLPSGDLVVSPGIAGRSPIQFSLPDVDRPIAFSEPPATLDFEPACQFTLDSVASVHQVLARFAIWLRPLASQLCLAGLLVRHEHQLALRGVYHVSDRGRLLAVVDLRGDVGVLPTAVPTEFGSAQWSARPSSARYIPDAFQRETMSVLMWQYAVRAEHDLLPARYRQGPIYYRRPPRLPYRLLRDSHLFLMRELSGGARTFNDLLRITAREPGLLAHDLAALYLVGSITANPRRARAPATPVDAELLAHEGPRSSGWPSAPSRVSDFPVLASVRDATAPMSLSARG